MKTTRLGRIGAIATGAAMLGVAISGALVGAQVPSTLAKGFFFNDQYNPIVQVVVGEKSLASDGAAAGQIAAVIGNLAYEAQAKQKTQTVTVKYVDEGCPASVCAGVEGTGTGAVTLSWAASGVVGDLMQQALNCSYVSGQDEGIYDDGERMICLEDGSYNEMCITTETPGLPTFPGGSTGDAETETCHFYTPCDALGEKNIGACGLTTGLDVYPLLEREFPNILTSLCYGFCDIALAQEMHLMSEWVELQTSLMEVRYDCEDQELVLDVYDDGIIYNVFFDDIPISDMFDSTGSDKKLVDQAYRGRAILAQQDDWFVEDLKDDKIVLAKGMLATGITVDNPITYKGYEIRLVGAQTVEETGVVDATFIVKKPDGSEEQVISGISGTPVVGDLKMKLTHGTSASNVITGESTYSVDMVIYYLPSELTIEDDEDYNGFRAEFYVYNLSSPGSATDVTLEYLEDEGMLTGDWEFPATCIDENEQYDDGYDEVYDQTSEVLRLIRFSLDDMYTLREGETLFLPFGSKLGLTFKGLMDSDYIADELKEFTELKFWREDVEIDDDYTGEHAIWVSFVDDYDDSITARIDEGPFSKMKEVMIVGDTPVKLVDYVEGDDVITTGGTNGTVNVTYQTKRGTSWSDDTDCILYPVGQDSAGTTGKSTGTADVDHGPRNMTVVSVHDLRMVTIDYENASCDNVDGIVGYAYANSTTDPDGQYGIYIYDNDDRVNTTGFNATMVGANGLVDEVNNRIDSTGFASGVGNNSNLSFFLWADNVEGMDTAFTKVDFYATNGEVYVTGPGIDLPCTQSLYGNAFRNFMYFTRNTSLYQNVTEGYDGEGLFTCELYDECTNETEARPDSCSLEGDCADYASGSEDGKLVTLDGGWMDIKGTRDLVDREDEEPELTLYGDEGDDEIQSVTLTMPSEQLYPTLFFGTQQTSGRANITLTDADEGTEVSIAGVAVKVEDFGVTGTIGGGTGTGAATADRNLEKQETVTVDYNTNVPKALNYNLVVVEGSGVDTTKNMVLIGGPLVNSMTKDLVTGLSKAGDKTIVLSGTNKLIVAGYSAQDTLNAAAELVRWLQQNVHA